MTYAISSYTGSGTVGPYNVSFPYIAKSHVEVRVGGVLKTILTDYTWPTVGTIQFVAAVANGVAIEFKRNSNKGARLVDYQDASVLTEATMDADATQLLYISQETLDSVGATLVLGSDATWDAQSHIIKNVTDGAAAQDAATVGQLAATALNGAGVVSAIYAPLASPALTGSPTVPLQALVDNSTKAASTSYADRAGNNAATIAAGRNIAARTNSVSPDTKLDISADELCLRDANSLPFRAAAVAVTINFGTVGANGIDVGVQAASTWYYGWVIAKVDGTIAGLGSLSATAPTMPAGYTFKALVTAARSNGSTQFTNYRQYGNECFIVNPSTVLSGGAASSETAIATSGVAPPIAQTLQVVGEGRSSYSVGVVSDDTLIIRVVATLNHITFTTFATVSGEPRNYQFSVRVPNTGLLAYAVTRGSSGGTGMYATLYVTSFTLPVGGF